MVRRFKEIDVFGAGKLGGNPLAVVLDSEGLTVEEMHAFARWTNLSETTFVFEPSDRRADYGVRIFTPRGEIAFAGHPTLGTCHAWLEAHGTSEIDGGIVQECQAGLIDLRQTREGLAFAAPPLLRSGPLGEPLISHVAEVLQIKAADILAGEWVDNGAGWAAVLLRDADAVLDLRPATVDLDVGVVGPHAAHGPADFEVRAFYPKEGATAEDPVTGSLNAGIAQWLIAEGRATAPYDVRQGTVIGHNGRVRISQDDKGLIWVGGATTTLIEGVATL